MAPPQWNWAFIFLEVVDIIMRERVGWGYKDWGTGFWRWRVMRGVFGR
jgi:hypothetical protein